MWTALLVPVLAGVFLLAMERLETRLFDVAPAEGAGGSGPVSRLQDAPAR